MPVPAWLNITNVSYDRRPRCFKEMTLSSLKASLKPEENQKSMSTLKDKNIKTLAADEGSKGRHILKGTLAYYTATRRPL